MSSTSAQNLGEFAEGFPNPRQALLGAAILAIGTALFLISRANYLLFHVLAEIFSVVIAFSVFVLAWNSRKFLENDYLLFTGIVFFFIAGLDLVHTFSYEGMGVFPGQTANMATQLWISARYMQSISMIIAPFMLKRRINVWWTLAIFTAITAIIILSIFAWGIFPNAFILRQGLTDFKIVSEYIIVGLFFVAGMQLYQRRRFFDQQVFRWLIGFLIASIASEMSFTAYISVYAPANALGHLFKVLAFFFLYKAILETGFVKPYNLLFRNLARREEELKAANQELENDLRIRKEMEQALRKSESRLRRLVDANIIGVMFSSIDGKVRDSNDYLLDLIGYSRAEMQAGQLCWVNLTPPEFEPVDRLAVQEAMANGACTPYEKEFIRKDGSRVPVMVGYARLEEGDELVCFVLDLSLRKQVEASLAEYAQRLERSNRELEDFAFVASHDLQEPLRKIQTFGGRLEDMLGDRLNEQEQDYLARMLNAATRMRNIINDLLALSRVTTQGQPFTPVNLTEIAQEVLTDLEVQVEKSGGRVDIGDLPVIDADPSQMRQLMQNLISNGLKFKRPEAEPHVRVRAEIVRCSGVPHARIDVEDNGIGFDPEHAERIFQPFHRLHGRTEYDGSGMGLTICRKIVERHNGKILANSRPGVGSVFTVFLPVQHLDGAPHETERSDNDPAYR